MRKALLVSAILVLAWVPETAAQVLPLDGKLFVDVNALYQTASQTIDQQVAFARYDEEGAFETTQRVKGSALWDLGFGYTVWRDLAIGLGISQFSRNQTMAGSGQVPHPLFYNEPRALATETRTRHKWRAIYLQALWKIRLSGAFEKVDLRLLGGPAHLRVWQGVAADSTITETGPPYSTVNVDVDVATKARTVFGVTGGVDVAYRLTENIGVGMLLRYTGGSTTFEEPLGGDSVKVRIGGFHAGGGIRLRF